MAELGDRRFHRTYGDGSPLTRGEFIAHAERWDELFELVSQRLEGIENKLSRPKRRMLAAAAMTAMRFALIAGGLVATYAAAHFGFGFGVG